MGLLIITFFSIIIFLSGLKIIFSKNGNLDRFFDSLILIILGILLLSYNYSKKYENIISFKDGTLTLKSENKNYIIIFSKTQIDLSYLESLNDTTSYDIKIFFSNVKVKSNSYLPFDFDLKGFLYSSQLHSGIGYLTGQIDENTSVDSLNIPIKIKFKLYFSSLKISKE
uniref:Cell wall-active antibiotics response LiaF-like C-terminal domain-containing protein n=1 Tax=candidate division WOR-3 bacterium TaxID=2052148 RepID=A0A7C3N9F9_UNCW3